jgi:hypothetical protein
MNPSLHFLSNDVNVDLRSVSQEFVDHGKVKVPSPPGLRGTPEDHLRNVLLAHYSCELLGDAFSFCPDHLRAQVLGKLEILAQRSLVVWIFIGAGVDIDDKQIRINTLRHPGRAGN